MANWEFYIENEWWVRIGVSIAIFLIFHFFRKIFSKYIFSILLKMSRKTPTKFLSYVFESFEKPVQWLFTIIGIYLAAKYFPHFNENGELFRNCIQASIMFLIGWGCFNLSSTSTLLLTKANKQFNIEIDEIIIPFLSKVIRAVVVAVFFTIIVQVFGYEISGFIAGLGIGGLAISLAAKDALANFIGGIVIITEKPFSIGDWILTPSVEGVVEDISFRSTKVRTFAQALVTVPNATLANENITNWSEMGKRQIKFDLKVAYDTPKENLQNVVRKIDSYLRNHPDIHPETIFVKFDTFAENGYSIFLYFFTKTTVWGEFLKVKEEINFTIIDILESENVELAIPSRKIYSASESGLAIMKKGHE